MVNLGLYRFGNDEISENRSIGSSKDMMDIPEAEGKQFKKLGKCRSRLNKVDFSLDCGMEVDGDQNGQGTPSSREEKVSSLRTVSSFRRFGMFLKLIINVLRPISNII